MCLGNPLEGLLIVGQLHIRMPTKTKVSTTTKKRIVKEALEIMDTASNSCVVQPTVAILCGDVNLMQDDADACCQLRSGGPDLLTQWHTQTSSAGLSGDVAFVRGCDSQAFDVTIGQSYPDRGMRKDCHEVPAPRQAHRRSVVRHGGNAKGRAIDNADRGTQRYGA